MSLDHGTLNLPLHKRCNIHADIDRLKAAQRQAEKDAAAERRRQTEEAKAYLATLSGDRVARIAEKAGLTVKQVRMKLNSMAHWEPSQVLRMKQADEAPSSPTQ